MNKCCQVCRKSFSRITREDRGSIAKYHHVLLDLQNWELSSPSKTLPTLAVLMRSGTNVHRLQSVAGPSLASTAACMTNSEKSMLQKVSSFFSAPLGHLFDTEATSHTVLTGSDVVVQMYAQACSGRCVVFPLRVTDGVSAFLRDLTLTQTLTLLELLVSRHVDVGNRDAIPVTLVLDHINDLLTHIQPEFPVVWWLLSALRGDQWCIGGSMDSISGKGLFMTCVRTIHSHLPVLSPEQLMISYLSLDGNNPETRPFVVISELEKKLLEVALDGATSISCAVLLNFMRTPFVESHPSLCAELCLSWYRNKRIIDMSITEARAAIRILSRLHVGSCEIAMGVSSHSEWQQLHDSLFALLHAMTHDLCLQECVAILEEVEVINVSPMGIAAPAVFVEKVKRRVLAEAKKTKRAVERTELELNADAATVLLESLMRFNALVGRFSLIPFSEADNAKIISLVTFFHSFCCSAALGDGR